MNDSWNYGPVEFEVPAGEPTAIELKVPHRGSISSIRLLQLDGADGGTFRIFNSERAAREVTGSSASSAVPGQDPDSYAVMPRKTITGGKCEEFQQSYQYRNRDGTYTMPIRRLWMVIEPTGSGSNTYSLSLTITPSQPY